MMITFFVFSKWLSYNGRLIILLLGSFYFYIHWMPIFLPLLIWIILFNFFYGRFLMKHPSKKGLLAIGILVDLLPLLFFKYTNFIISNINAVVGLIQPEFRILPMALILPLGISFFTFQAIAYLVDCSKKDMTGYSLLEFGVFIAFWPQLIAGPILHHSEIIPQLKNPSQKQIQTNNLIIGASVFIMGATKKLLIADKLAPMADYVFSNPGNATSISAFLAAISYTFQLYFDFSGYCDMAYGSAKMFNIELPFNFLSPYKSRDIQEFWRHWHITLSRWLRDYIYIPLGGRRTTKKRTFINLLITFLVGGIWHGAGWNFIIWGILHGVSVGICHLRANSSRHLPKIIGGIITMFIVIVGWVFFRASSVSDALVLLSKIAFWDTFRLRTGLEKEAILLCFSLSILVWFAPNSKEIMQEITSGKRILLWGGMLGILCPLVLLCLLAKDLPASPFLYFQF